MRARRRGNHKPCTFQHRIAVLVWMGGTASRDDGFSVAVGAQRHGDQAACVPQQPGRKAAHFAIADHYGMNAFQAA